MIGYKYSCHWKLKYPIYLINFNPEHRALTRFRIFAISKIHQDDAVDFFKYIVEGGLYVDGVAHKSRFFRTYPAAYNGLLKLLKEDYAENLALIKALKDNEPLHKNKYGECV